MKWYKHLSGSLKDSVIFEAVELFGSDAYLVFFGTLELLADEFDIENPGTVRLSIKKMTAFFQLSRQKTVRILQHFDKIASRSTIKSVSFSVQIDKDHVTIHCPKFSDLCDEYTQKKLLNVSGVNRDKLQKISPPITDIDKEEDIIKEKKEVKRKKSFTSADVTLTDYFRSFASKNGFDNGTCEELFDRFKDYCLANNKTYLDWDAAWRTWVKNEIKFKKTVKKENIPGVWR